MLLHGHEDVYKGVWDFLVLGFKVAQTPRFPQTPEIQVSVMCVPHMSGSGCAHHVDTFRVEGF